MVQRVSLLMYKYSLGEVPSPISILFRTNITYHEHNTRSASAWNYISLKVNTDVLYYYACFKKLFKHHLQSNPTPLIRLNFRQKTLDILNF